MKYEVIVIICRTSTEVARIVIIIGAGAKQSTGRTSRVHDDRSVQSKRRETQALVLVAPRVYLPCFGRHQLAAGNGGEREEEEREEEEREEGGRERKRERERERKEKMQQFVGST